ncbi:unnamed protein product [Ceratitis capitata]|uniref:(Mediterranean fruit fly) hypothetical protein n=1 Tax=Ceratitis capitata TaxID=7213 RepID=A0A811VJM3_CERCA|nr:unnamed protein product [Ceratitis capitata]
MYVYVNIFALKYLYVSMLSREFGMFCSLYAYVCVCLGLLPRWSLHGVTGCAVLLVWLQRQLQKKQPLTSSYAQVIGRKKIKRRNLCGLPRAGGQASHAQHKLKS